jgi:hypothetical protein
MKWNGLIIVASILLILLSPVLFRKRTISLISNGNVVAVAKRTYVAPWSDGKVDVYVGDRKMFSLWTDIFDGPLFIYPFADGQRYLCDFDDDTAMLVFIVDFRNTNSIGSASPTWPADGYLRSCFVNLSSNVVMDTTGRVRIPFEAEVKEMSSNVETLTESELENRSFPFNDLGIYRFYASKDFILHDIKTNRQSVW